MILKFVFKNEIHRCSKVPADFSSLLVALKQIFKDNLPEFFTLQYDDADGDKIMLTSNEDYKTMLEGDMNNSQASVKIYVTPSEKNISVGNLTVKADEKKPEPEIKPEPKVEEIKKPEPEIKKPVEEKIPVIEEKIPVVEKKDPFTQALVEAEEAMKKFNVEPELEAKVHALVLKTFKTQIDLVAGAVRENIVKSQENVKPTTPEGLIETLVYVQKLAQGVEGATNEQIQGINVALKQAIDQVKSIQDKKAQEKKPPVEEQKKPVEEQKKPVEEQKKPVEEKKPEPKPVENKPADTTDALSGEFLKEISQLPAELTEKDINLYKTIVIRNNGKETYPAKTFIECVSSKENARISVSQIHPGKEFTTVLIINSPGKPGKYTTTWAFMCEKPDGTLHEFGKRFDVHFEIIGGNTNHREIVSNHALSHIEKKPEPKPTKPEVTYSQEIKEKAISIKEVFPQYNIDDICEYISKSPQKTLEELFNEYMSLHTSISN